MSLTKTQTLHKENKTNFNKCAELIHQGAFKSIRDRMNKPLNFNRSKKIAFQLKWLLILLSEGIRKPTLTQAKNRSEDPEITEPEPVNISYPPKAGPLTLDELEKYNNDYKEELKKQRLFNIKQIIKK